MIFSRLGQKSLAAARAKGMGDFFDLTGTRRAGKVRGSPLLGLSAKGAPGRKKEVN